MAVENLTATARAGKNGASHGLGATLKAVTKIVEVTAAASATSTYDLGNFPSNARLLGASKISFDDLASTGSPTFDIGLFAVDGNITDDDDAINDGIDVATAAATVNVVKTIDNWGLPLWDFVNGQTSDPGGLLNMKITLKDAATNTGGTVAVELFYVID